MVDEQTSENGGISTHYEDAKDCSIIWSKRVRVTTDALHRPLIAAPRAADVVGCRRAL